MERIFAGIDISKDRLDVHLRPLSKVFAVANDGKGMEELADRLRALGVSLAVVEATGGYEVTVAAVLCAAGVPLAVVNPRQIGDLKISRFISVPYDPLVEGWTQGWTTFERVLFSRSAALAANAARSAARV